jgi:hypothetical protein
MHLNLNFRVEAVHLAVTDSVVFRLHQHMKYCSNRSEDNIWRQRLRASLDGESDWRQKLLTAQESLRWWDSTDMGVQCTPAQNVHSHLYKHWTNKWTRSAQPISFCTIYEKNAVIDLIVTKEAPSNTDVYKLLNSSGKVAATCLGGQKLSIACIQQDTWN